MIASSCLGRSSVDRRAHLLVSTATADVGDRPVDVGVGRLPLDLKQRGNGHDHPALAIAALRYIMLDPRLLHRVQGAISGETFDCRDLLAFRRAHRKCTGAYGNAIDMHGARTALGDAATILGPRKAHPFANDPQKRRVRIDVYFMHCSIDGETTHDEPPYSRCKAAAILHLTSFIVLALEPQNGSVPVFAFGRTVTF